LTEMIKMGIFGKFFEKDVTAAVHKAFDMVENENSFLVGTRTLNQSDRDRYAYDRKEVL